MQIITANWIRQLLVPACVLALAGCAPEERCTNDEGCVAPDGGATDAASDGNVSDGDAPDDGAIDSDVRDSGATIPGDTCELAELIDIGSGQVVLSDQSTTGFTPRYGYGIGCPGTEGSERVYAVDVPAYHWLIATVTPSGTFDPSVHIGSEAACAVTDRICRAGDDAGSPSSTNTARTPNNSAQTVRWYVFVDSSSVSATGDFTLELETESFIPGETCEVAIDLPTDGKLVSGTTDGLALNYATAAPCPRKPIVGPDIAYRLTVPAQHSAEVILRSHGSFDPAMLVASLDGCRASQIACLAQSDNFGAPSLESLWVSNPTDAPIDRYILIGSRTDSVGTFDLKATVAPLMPGETCENPILGTIDGPALSGTLVGSVPDYAFEDGTCSYPGNALSPGPDHAYRYSVPAKSAVEFSAIPEGFDIAMALVESRRCDRPLSCTASANHRYGSTPERLQYANRGDAARDVTLLVRGNSIRHIGRYTVSAMTIPLEATQLLPADGCAAAPEIPASRYTRISGAIAGSTDTLSGGVGCLPTDVADGKYKLRIPDGQMVRVTATPTDGSYALNLHVTPTQACDGPFECESSRYSNSADTPRVVTAANFTGVEKESLLVVGSPFDTEGTFELVAEWLPQPPVLPPGDTCSTATPLAIGESISGSLYGLAADYEASESCERESVSSALRPDGVYVVEVPGGQTLEARATAMTRDVKMWIVDGDASACDTTPLACAASAHNSENGAEIRWANAGANTKSVFLIVSNDSFDVSGGFLLETRLFDTPAGDTCTNPIVLDGAGVFTFFAPTEFSSQMALVCGNDATVGSERIHQITVPSGQTVVARAHVPFAENYPTRAGDPGVYIIAADPALCTLSPTTLACANGRSEPAPETSWWKNDTGQDADVYVVVDSNKDASGALLLDVQLTP